jgi:hypothetical protein
VLDRYTAALRSAPLSDQTRRTYTSKVRQYLAWLADADLDSDPLTSTPRLGGARLPQPPPSPSQARPRDHMACTANPDAAPPRGTATKQTVSCADMLAALRRDLIRHQYRAQAPAATSGTTNHARPVTVRPR